MNRKLLTTAACGAMMSVLTVAPALAQVDGEEAQDDSRRLGAVTVTAQRTEESMQDVPVAVTALDANLLEDRQVRGVLDLQYQVPNINLGTNTGTGNTARVFLRGVGEDESRGMVDPAVGIYLDGVYLGRAAGALLDVVDLSQVEVLRGPQGTLYGRNTIGGAIKLDAVRPQFENSGKVGATFGNYGRTDFRATGNFQLGDKTAFRISGLKRERDGFWDVIPNGAREGEGKEVGIADVLSVRASMLHEFDSDWSLYVSADRTLDRSDSIPDSLPPGFDADGDVFTIEPAPGTECDLTTERTGCFTAYNARSQSQGISAEVKGKLGTYDFTSVTAYRELNNLTSVLIGSFFSEENDQDQVSQEFTFASNYEGPFNFLTGLYYYKENVQLDTIFFFPFSITGETESYAAFAQGTYDVTDQLAVTGGLRYTQEKKTFDGINETFNFTRVDDADYDNLSFSVGADYRINDSVMTYAKYATGFKGGGWSPDAFSPTAIFLPVEEETLDSFEVGFKSDLFNDTVRLNAAAFMNKYEGLQISATVPNLGFTRFNVPEAEIKGLEFEATWQATNNLQLSANLGLLDAEYTELDLATAAALTNQGATPACGGVVSLDCAYGLDLKNAPEYKGAINALYTLPVDTGEFIFTGDVSFEDNSWSLVANSPYTAYNTVSPIVNIRAKYEDNAGWSAAVWAKNLADQEYWRAGLGSGTVFASQPMTFGIDLGYEF